MVPGAVTCIISFICHVPLGMMGISGLNTYKKVQDLGDIYDVIPHGQNFLRGMGILAYAGTLAFAWNFVQFVVAPCFRGYILATMGVLDMALAITLIAGVAMEAQFLPATYGPCEEAANWNNGTDGRNFFVVAGATERFEYKGDDANGICRNLMANWATTIAVIILYILCAIHNMIFGFLGKKGNRYDSFMKHKFPQFDLDICGPVLIVPLRLLLIPVYYVYGFLHGSVYISVRYISKYRARNKGQNHRKAKNSKKSEKAIADPKPPSNPRSLRLPMELVLMITQDFHYTDLVNLHRSSKLLRHIFFGDATPLQVSNELRQFVCKGGTPLTPCAICNIQTCRQCRYKAGITRTPALHHLQTCHPLCTACFYKTHCLRKHHPPAAAEQAETDARARHGNQLNAPWLGLAGRKGWRQRHKEGVADPNLRLEVEQRGRFNSVMVYRPVVEPRWEGEVCRNCWGTTAQEVDALHVVEVGRRARGRLACYQCGGVLGDGGVRWWVDGRDGWECRWEGHPGWAGGG